MVSAAAARQGRAYSVSAARAFPSVDYGASSPDGLAQPPSGLQPTPTAAGAAAFPDPFDLANDDAGSSSQPTPTNSFYAAFATAPTGSRSSSRSNSRVGSRPVSPAARQVPLASPSTRPHTYSHSRTTSRAGSRRASETEPYVRGDGLLSIPQLTTTQLFLPLPNSDPLSTLLSKYIPSHLRPPRDIEGLYEGQTVEQLVTAGSWRALARLARDTIVSADPENVALIFDMFHLRHLALLNLHLPNLHAREIALLFQSIAALPPAIRSLIAERDALPFGLEVMLAQTDGVDALNALLKRCRGAIKRARDEQGKELWRERLRRVGVVLAGLLTDLGESVAALHLLSPLVRNPTAPPSVLLAVHRLHLQMGNLPAARAVLARVQAHAYASRAEKAVAGALEALARGEWDKVEAGLQGTLQNCPPDSTDALVAAVVLSVAQLYSSQPDQAIATLEAAVSASPSAALIEPVIFNLTTLYELRLGAAAAGERKLDLLVKVAQWEGDGLRPACLKLM